VANPQYFPEAPGSSPLGRVAPLGAAAFELWTTDRGYLFDGVLVAPAVGGAEAAAAYRRDVWRRRYGEEVGAGRGEGAAGRGAVLVGGFWREALRIALSWSQPRPSYNQPAGAP
jgi:hypothetical protein